MKHRTEGESAPAASSIASFPARRTLPRLLGRREWIAAYEEHEIRVVRGPFRARLFLDGECRDRRTPFVAMDRLVPLLSASLPSRREGVVIVEVYARAILAGRIAIRVAGKWIPLRELD